MKVRELLVSVKMMPDTQSISQTEQTISSIKESMQGIGSAAAAAGGQINGSVIEMKDTVSGDNGAFSVRCGLVLNMRMVGLPKFKPDTAGTIWNDNGTLKIVT